MAILDISRRWNLVKELLVGDQKSLAFASFDEISSAFTRPKAGRLVKANGLGAAPSDL